MNYLLGIDAGTTSIKIALFDENGNIVVKKSEEYTLLTNTEGYVEFPAEEYWRVCRRLLNEITGSPGVQAGDIRALAIDSQGETLICVDGEGNPLCNAIVWLDNRAVEEAVMIGREFGAEKVYHVTGQPEVLPCWPASKILWLRRKNPEVFNKTAKFLLLEDYLIFRLTGRYAAEKSLLSSTIMLDINKGAWWEDMLDFIRITSEQLPEIKDSAAVAGYVKEQAAAETGLHAGTFVVTGALDQAAGMLGAGGISEGCLTETTGTCLAVCVNTGGKEVFPLELKVPRQCGLLPGSYFSMFWSPTAGIVLKWFKENFCIPLGNPLQYTGSTDDYKLMDLEAGLAPAGCDGLVMLPHLSGTSFPDYNPAAKGVFSGFSLAHKRGHFIRAVMESAGYLLKQYVTAIESAGIAVNDVRSLGGGAGSRLWCSIKADILQKNIVTLETSEATCLGAAMLAGVGAGMFESVEAACCKLVHKGGVFLPDGVNAAVYENGYTNFLKLHKDLYG